ncbi:hypothetical protein [Empedobacter sp. UBA1574]|uniref:hypothetical protein n=1 Tax=Empedobacter sp. UBA1574 TaxID=1946429 RepID=UPI0025C29212|nr:hypothetical protein [Empedobacter sp. UBA1574]
MKNIILLILFVFTPLVKAQTTSCQDVYEFILDKGYKANSINLAVYSSSMLVKVERYTYDGKNFVVGFIKQNDYDSKGAPYLFCGVSSYDWSSFQYNYLSSAGEAFHKYIMPYKCNCR